ncbi:MAG: Crp/Fnr family transcriptional regulator [Bacteroidia bacterium]|nr:Crp/Fnr family transcriptional regulator [Bacteroidia bacterium]
MWEGILQNIGKYITLTEDEIAYFKSVVQFKKLRKRQYLVQEGEVVKYESYVIKGCLRAYQVTEKGQEHVVQFAIEDWWIGDLYSFLTGTPATLNIDCLEDCELLQITKESLEELYIKVPKFERMFRILFQNAFVHSQKRLLSTIATSAQEHYTEFIKKYPNIDQRVPNHQIASYLGITAESLSRIRAQLVSKK